MERERQKKIERERERRTARQTVELTHFYFFLFLHLQFSLKDHLKQFCATLVKKIFWLVNSFLEVSVSVSLV